MSATIDQRIMEMKLDNQQFESHAQQTIKTVNQLNESLKLNNATQGFSNLEKGMAKVTKSLKTTQTQIKKTADSMNETAENTKKAQKGFKDLQETAEKAVSTFSKIRETINKAINFDPVSASVKKFKSVLSDTAPDAADSMEEIGDKLDELTEKFDVAGLTWQQIIKKSTDGLTNMVASIASIPANAVSTILSMPLKAVNQVVSGGWSRATNIDQAKHQLKGLEIAWEDIEGDINYAVADTAYGLDAAAQAASKLAAAGVEFGESFGDTGNSPMARALRGISGLAAMTNQSYERVAGIYSQISAMGRLMGGEMLQLSQLGGVNVYATLGKELGKTQEEIKDMMSKGMIDFQTFADAMNNAFGEHAKSANETLEGAMANMKAALSRIGADFAAPIRKNAVPIFNNLKARFAEIKKILSDTGVYDTFSGAVERIFTAFSNFVTTVNLSGFKDFAVGVKRLYKILSALFTSFVDFLDTSTAWLRRSVKQMLKAIDPITRLFTTVEKKMGIFKDVVKGISEDFTSLTKATAKDGAETMSKGLNRLVRSLDKSADMAKLFDSRMKNVVLTEEKLNEIANRVIAGEYGEGQARIDALKEEFGVYDLIIDKVEEITKSGGFSDALVGEKATEEAKKNSGLISKSLVKLTKDVKSSINDVTDDNSLQSKVKKYGENIQNTINRIADTFGESIRVVKAFFSSLNSMFSDEDKIELLSNVTDFVVSKFERLLHWVGVFNRVMNDSGNDLMRIISRTIKLAGKILGFIGRVRKGIWNILDALGWSDIRVKVLNGVIKLINGTLGKLLQIIDPIADKAEEGLGIIGEKIVGLKSGIITFYETLKETQGFKRLKEIFDSILNSAKSVFNFIAGKFLGLGNLISDKLDLGIEFNGWSEAAVDFGNFLDGIITKAGEIKNTVVSAFNMAIAAITSFLGIDMSSFGFSDGETSIIETFNNIVHFLTNNSVVTGVQQFFDDITEEGKFSFEKFKTVLDNMLTGFLSWAGEKIKTVLSKVLNWILNGGVADVYLWVVDKLETLLSGILPPELVTGVADILRTLLEWLKSFDQSVMAFAKEHHIGETLWSWATELGKGLTALATALNSENIGKTWENFKKGLAGFSIPALIASFFGGEHAPGIKASFNNPFAGMDLGGIVSTIIDGFTGAFFGHKVGASTLYDEIDFEHLTQEQLNDLANGKIPQASASTSAAVQQAGATAAAAVADDIMGDFTSGFNQLIIDVCKKLEEFNVGGIFNTFKTQVEKIISDLYDEENPLESIIGIINKVLLGSVALSGVAIFRNVKSTSKSIKNIFKESEDLPEVIKTTFKGLGASFKSIPDSITGLFTKVTKSLTTGLDSAFSGLTDVEKAIAKEHKAAKWEHIANTFLKITAGIALLVGVIFAIYYITKNGDIKAFQQAAGAFLIIAGAIAILAVGLGALFSAISKLQKRKDEGSTVVNALNNTVALSDGIQKAIQKFLKKIGTGVMLVGLGIAIATIAGAFVKLAKLDTKQVGNGALALVTVALAIAGVMSGLIAVMNFTSGDDKSEHFTLRDSLFIVALGGAITLAANALVKMAKLPVSAADQGVKAFETIIGSCEVLLLLTKNYSIQAGAGTGFGIDLEAKNSFGSIIGIILILWTVASKLKKLSKIKPERLKSAVDGMKTVLDHLSIAMASITAYNLVNIWSKNTLGVIGLISVVMGETYLLILGLYSLADEQERFNSVTNGISKIFGTLGELISSIAMLSFSNGIAGLLPGGATIKSLDNILGFTIITTFITALSYILTLIEGEEGRVTKFIDTLYPIIKKAANCLAKVIGLIVEKGFLKPIAKTFGLGNLGEQIGTTVSDILAVLKSVFSYESDDYDANKADAFGNTISKFAGILKDMVGISKAAKKIDKDKITDAIGKVTAIAEGLVGYSVAASQIDATKITEVTSAIEGIIKYVKEIKGGVVDKVSTVYDASGSMVESTSTFKYLNDFINELIPFADGIKQYSDKIQGVRVDTVNATSAAVETILTLAKKVPDQHSTKDGSIMSWIFGSNDIAEFAPKLFPFARGMVYYSKTIKNMDKGAVTSTNKACKVVLALANAVPDQHGNDSFSIFNKIFGSNDIAEFAPKLFTFARGMIYYSKTIKGMDTEAVASTESACQTILKLAEAVPPQEGLIGWILGDTSIENFGHSLITFARGMYSYATVVGNTNFQPAIDRTEDVKELMSAYADLLTHLDSVNMLWETVENFGITNAGQVINHIMEDITLEKENRTALNQIGVKMFTRIMEGFEEAVKNPQNAFDASKTNPLDNAIALILAVFEDDLQSLATTDNVVKTFSSFFGTAMEAAANELNAGAFSKLWASADEVLADESTPGAGGIVSAVNKILAAIKLLFENNGSEIKKQLDDLVDNITNAADSMSTSAYNSGRYVMIGLYNGLRDASKYPINAAQNIGQSVIAALNSGLTVASPAREAIKSGMFVDKGLEIGLTDNQNGLFSIAKNIGSSVISALNNGTASEKINPLTKLTNWVRGAAGLFNDILNDAIDMSPVITPVLDMSAFDKTRRSYQGFNIDGTAQLARTSMNRANNFQNNQVSYDDRNVIKAINSMNQSVNVLGARLNKMQVVLDSGALVGELSGGIDARLGSMNKYGKRWA